MLKTENLLKNRCRYYSHNERHYERHSPAFSAAEQQEKRHITTPPDTEKSW